MKRIIVLIVILNAIAFSLSASSRYALVIGNGNYEGAYLRNPVNDANAIAATLRELDFYVIQKTDLTKKQMVDAIRDFENRLTSQDVSLFYYSRHGAQVNGINYLIPLKANIISEKDVEFEAVALNRFMSNIEKAKMNIVILDACRDNPYKGTRSTSKGLAQVTSKTDGTFIAYATAPGTTAKDGTGSNSPYTKHLIREMKVEGQEIEDMFKNVRIAVKDETNNAQIPWDSSCLTDKFIFAMSCTPEITEPKYEPGKEQEYKSEDNLVFVQGGTFEMGSNKYDDEKPIHTVTVNDFYIGKYEVTNREFIEFLNSKQVNSNGSYSGTEYIDMDDEDCAIGYRNGKFYFKESRYANDTDCPVIEVTWYGANAYCKWKGGRLPTEAEWEYAARGGNKSRDYTYSGSNNIGTVAWYTDNSGNKTHKVGTKQPNELGIYDMSGNVWEWCSDWYDSNYYSSSPRNNPTGPNSGTDRVLRGGSWRYNDISCRVANRKYDFPDYCYYPYGFRFSRAP